MAVTLTEYDTLKRLVAVGNNEVFYEDINVAAGTMVELVAANGDINTADNLNIFEGYQKVFVVNGANLKIADFVNTKLTMTALTTAPTRGATVTQVTSGATMVVDSVSSDKTIIYGKTTNGTFTTTSGHTLSGGSMAPTTRVPSAVAEASTTPHWYDYVVFPDGASGALPTKAYLGCLYRGRVVLAGVPDAPHQWHMSRQADHTDFAYVANDAQSPVAGSDADAGEIGDIIRALIPYKDDYLIVGCATSIWVLRGDPAAGGSLDEVDLTVGIYGANSWCFDSEGNIYFWGTGGIYFLPRDFGPVQNISQVTLPELIKDEAADPTTHRVVLGYDRKRFGVIINITKLSDGSNSNYFYSLNPITRGFFPESYPDACGAYSSFYYDANDTAFKDLLIGCKDGYIRKYDTAAKDDDSGASDTAISSRVLYPIIQLSEDDIEGKLSSVTVEISGGASGGAHTDSDGVTMSLYAADDAETLVEDVKDGATAFSSITFSTTGRQKRVRNKMRGAYAGIELTNTTAAETWAINRILYERKDAGRIK